MQDEHARDNSRDFVGRQCARFLVILLFMGESLYHGCFWMTSNPIQIDI